MPVTFEIKDGVIALRMIGSYTTSELRDVFLDAIVAADPAETIGMTFDVSKSDSLASRSAEDVAAMGYFMASHGDRFGRRIALIGSEDFKFGMMRLGSATLDHQQMTNQVFRTEQEALAWLHQR
jgi:hypothetical protein